MLLKVIHRACSGGGQARIRFSGWRWLCAAAVSVSMVWMLVLATGCEDERSDGPVEIQYWEKWTGFEADAMRAVVDDFNASQDRVFVKMLSVSNIDQKLLLSTAGGNPPDVVGVWTHTVPVYAEKGALTPLDKYLAEAGMGEADYIPAIWACCRHRGFTWALPATPASIALHWNKKMFEAAGLDPDKPPTSIAELEVMAEQLTLVELTRGGEKVRVRYPELTEAEREAKDFKIIQLGHSPKEPGWWLEVWGYWFGGEVWDGDRTVTAMSDENVRTFEWLASYSQKYGRKNLDTFGASFGNVSSPQNPFLSGQVAMIIQGPWMHNFIEQYSPGMRWGVAPFPSGLGAGEPPVTVIESDVLVIPRGAKHPAEAFEFIRYVNSRGPMEKLCLGQRKFSPLTDVSETFISQHPNPYIEVFVDLAKSPRAKNWPRLPIWDEYKDEIRVASDQVYIGDTTVHEALGRVQERMQLRFDRVLRRWDLVEADRLAEWGAR